MLSNSDKFKDDSYMHGMGAFSSQEVSSSKDVSMGDGEDYSHTHQPSESGGRPRIL
jgi:hypothetical protein